MLNISNVAQYLLGRGVLNAATLVDDGLLVRDVSSRHCNFRVEVPSGGGFHLKQGTGPDTRASVAREAAVYRSLGGANGRLREVMPDYRDYDEAGSVLILGLIDGAEDLRALHLRTREFRPDVGAAIGAALAKVHTSALLAPGVAPLSAGPPFLGIYRPGVEIFRNASAANLELIRIVQGVPELCARLDAIRETPHCETLLHNDVKWDNFLLTQDALRLVDWETAEIGDPAWDLGSAFGQYLSWWLFSIPASGSDPVANFADLATVPLTSIKIAINACWTTYFTTRALSSSEASDLLLRAVAMTGVRLLQSAFEASQFATHLTSNDILHIQLASNILARPTDACHQLLGLPFRTIK